MTETVLYNFERPQFLSRKKNIVNYEKSAHLINEFFVEKRKTLEEKKAKIDTLTSNMSSDDEKMVREDLETFLTFYERFNEFYEQSLIYFRKLTVHKAHQLNMRSAFETYKSYLHEQFNGEEMKKLKKDGELSYCRLVSYC